ncbi:HNH endonuclease [Bdellovibrio sp. HCB2-146]|uniref:HNH endonuclease n=1 Tax=Bdellovibrio sp. HCB2-146 TaxID=3394362 RepID=UPI0039BD2595
MNINTSVKQLSDSLLLEQTNFLVERERADTILILRHLREIEIRRLFIDLKYSSMHKYCIKHLKYSEYETQMRLSSARLLQDLPEIENQIEKGDLNLTNLAQVQTFIRAEKSADVVLNKEQKLELLFDVQGKSTREVKKDLMSKSNQPSLLAEKFNVTLDSSNQVIKTFQVQLDEEHQAILQEFRDLYAHELDDQSDFNTLMFLLKKATQFKKKKLGLVGTVGDQSRNSDYKKNFKLVNTSDEKEVVGTLQGVSNRSNAPLLCAHKVSQFPQLRKALPASVKRQVWIKADGQCEHQDKLSKTRCESKHALEVDHVESVALGGTNEVANLRLLCRAHNSRRSIQTFGTIKL